MLFSKPIVPPFLRVVLYQSQTFIHYTFGTSFCQLQKTFSSIFLEQIDFPQLDFGILGQIFPVLSILELEKDQFLSKYIQYLVSLSSKVEELILTEYVPLDWVAGILQRIGKFRIKLIRIESEHFTPIQLLEKATLNTTSEELTISLSHCTFNSKGLKQLRTFSENLGDTYSLFLINSSDEFTGAINFFLTSNVKRVYLLNELQIHGHLTGHEQIPLCRYLTHLTLCGFYSLHHSVLAALSSAGGSGNLPQLTLLNFALCDQALTGKLHMLFSCSWPTLS